MSTDDGRAPTLSVSDAAAIRVRDARKRRGMTTKQLAEACARVGGERLTAPVLANIETGRRQNGVRRRELTIDELVIVAVALDVSPLHLMGMPDDAEPGTAIQLTSELAITDSELLLAWLTGQRALPDSDSRQFYAATVQQMPASTDRQAAVNELTRSVLENRAAELVQQFNSELQNQLGQITAAIDSGASPEELKAMLRPQAETPTDQ
ncbi:helix-turn-helix domain-containing protein [Kitasatospora sp. NPDC051853]|uniref:helix-turn-helix domain-containing protein n=1 Tax=Kitasatospora sp. NPDC051853 TaxID=3364058 RepID=UPI0037896301